MTQTKPAVSAAAVTPSDSAANIFRALYVGSGGNLNLLLEGDTVPVVFVNVPSGTLLPVSVKKVYSTSTTASNIVGLK